MRQRRGFLKLRKGLVQNLHPELKVLDETFVPFEGYFHLDERFFYINYGYNNLDKGILSGDVKFIVKIIKEYEQDAIKDGEEDKLGAYQ
jgi:hypothetical protein